MNKRSGGTAAAPGQPDPPADFHFDHHAAAFVHGHKEINDEIRQHCPVGRTDAYSGFWVLSGHAEVVEAACDDVRFSSEISLLDATSRFELAGDGVVYPRTIGQLLGKKAVHIRMTPKEDSR